MKNLLFILAFIPSLTFSQKLHKLEGIDYTPLTLNPTIFDPNLDTSIVRIEFIQDTANCIYELDEEAKYSSIEKCENFEQVWAIGAVGDFRISYKKISVIIRTHHSSGETKTFVYTEKINKLKYYADFKWATYGTKGYYYIDPNRKEIIPKFTQKGSM